MTTTYRATIDNRFLSRVDRIFDASPRTVFNELLQNARRAGASYVRIELLSSKTSPNAVHVSFSDNGAGLPDPQPLLRLAGTYWQDDVLEAEDPAGMGFFSLSNFQDVRVTSRNWSASFSSAVFRGEEDLIVDWHEHKENGMLIQWTWPIADWTVPWTVLRYQAEKAAAYCGLKTVDIIFGGTETTVIPKDFLEGCSARAIFDGGARVGVDQYLSNARGGSYARQSVVIDVNFHGVEIRLLPGDLSEPLRQLCPHIMVALRVDVTRVGDLQLVLPARNALKHNEGRDQLLLECERSIYLWLRSMKKPEHVLPYSVYRRALDEFDIDIGPASTNALRQCMGWLNSNKAEDGFIAGEDMAINTTIGLADIWTASFTSPLFYSRQDLVGYAWYDAMPKLTEIAVLVNGEPCDMSEFFNDHYAGGPHCLELEWCDSIEVRWTVQDSNGRRQVSSPRTALVGGDTTTWTFDDVKSGNYRILLLKDCRTDPKKLLDASDILSSAIFAEADDMDVGIPGDEQRSNFDAAMTAALLEATGDTRGAARTALDNCVSLSNISWILDRQLWSWAVVTPEDATDPLSLVGPFNSPDCWKVLTVKRGGQPIFGAEVYSVHPLTEERVRHYLTDRLGGLLPDDDITLADRTPPVDLDSFDESGE